MITSAAIYHVLHFFHVTIDIRNVCVFLAPLFSSFTTVVTYHLTKELKVRGRPGGHPLLHRAPRAACQLERQLPAAPGAWRRPPRCSRPATSGKGEISFNFYSIFIPSRHVHAEYGVVTKNLKNRGAFPTLWLCFLPQDAGAGLLAAAMIAVVPGYISRSVAGSYDNEGEFAPPRHGETFERLWVVESDGSAATEQPSSPGEPRRVLALCSETGGGSGLRGWEQGSVPRPWQRFCESKRAWLRPQTPLGIGASVQLPCGFIPVPGMPLGLAEAGIPPSVLAAPGSAAGQANGCGWGRPRQLLPAARHTQRGVAL